MQSIEAIAKIIVDYGVVPVLIACMIFVLLHLCRKNRMQEERLTSLLQMINKNTNPKHTPEEEEINRHVNLLIDTQLRELLNKFGANRVCCYLYHNGGRDITGRSFQKMSMTHEVVEPNTVSVIMQNQNMPRMLFPILFQKLVDQGYYYIDDLSTIEEVDAVTYQIFKTRGAKSVYIRAIRDSNRYILGFIAVEYTTGKCENITDLEESIHKKAIKISGMLETTPEIPLNNKKKEGE